MRNRIKCKKCNDIIESKYRHDFQQCQCGKVFCDGGQEYQRIGFDIIDNVIRVLDDDSEEPFESMPTSEEIIEDSYVETNQLIDEVIEKLQKLKR